MKKIVCALLVCVMLFALASCTILSGTYSTEGGTLSYIFEGKNVTVKGQVLMVSIEFEGTYEIGKDEEGNQTITFNFSEDESDKYSGTFDFSQGTDSEKGSYISIAGVKYYKQ